MEIIEHPYGMLYLFQAYPIRLRDRDKTQPAEFELSGSHVTEVKMVAQPVRPNCTQITAVVNIGSPFKLEFGARKVFAGDVCLGAAQPAGMREGEYLYTLIITIVGRVKEITTTAPRYASAEIQNL
jgi:hypothetical protein